MIFDIILGSFVSPFVKGELRGISSSYLRSKISLILSKCILYGIDERQYFDELIIVKPRNPPSSLSQRGELTYPNLLNTTKLRMSPILLWQFLFDFEKKLKNIPII